MILCCGEALIDFVPLEQNIRGYRPCPGGSIYNIAVGLARLQTPAGYFGKVSTDFFGDLLMQYLAENGAATEYVIRADGLTTLAFVSLPGQAQGEPKFLIYANDTVDRSLTTAELPPQLPEAIKALHFGSISLVLEPGATSLETLLRRESGRRVISFDPNVRPGLIAAKEAYRQRCEGWVRLVDIVRLSLADLDWLYPGAEPEAIIQRWLSLGPSLCILTLGAGGSKAYTASGVAAAAAPPTVKVVDTVGAGDSFLAAVLAYLAQGGILYDRGQLKALSETTLTACLSYACCAAAINCSRPGANPAYKHELEAYLSAQEGVRTG